MKYKKTLAVALLISTLSTNLVFPAAHAKTDRKVLKTEINEYKYNYVNMDWWNNSNDEWLKKYIYQATNQNQDLKIATLKVEQAKHEIKLQLAKELPSATIGVAPAGLKQMGSTNTEGLLAFPLIVNYEADIFLKNHDKTKSSKKSYEISKIKERAAYISVAASVGSTYYNIVKLDKVIELQNKIINSRKQIYELTKKRNLQGIASTADLARAEKSLVMANSDLSDLIKTRTKLLNSLAVLTGNSPENIEELKRISYNELNIDLNIPSEISSDIITQRPDYIIAEKEVEKAGLDVKIAKKEFLPSINILGLLLFNTTSMSNSLNWTNALAALGGGALLPLFTGGQKTANLKLKKNNYEQVLQNYYKTNLIAIQEVNDALSSLKLDNEKFNKNKEALRLQKADFKYYQQRYKQGIISNLDVIQQEETLLVLDRLVVESKTNCYIDQIGIYKAVGGKL